ncbi:MAG TPA: DUF4184 family protein [Bacteroidia bacterium]|jgi:hypothetical protein|nr:DUF4184 family protein [Bacteroidia bacterium]
MGFTFSHPALVVPFKYLPRKYYSINGLIIGSIIPDFEYFIRLNNVSRFSHTIPGIFWFDIPLAILLLFLFHQVIRNELIHNLGPALQGRFLRYESFKWPRYFKDHWLAVLCSISIGALTHLVWDSFTSENGYFVEMWPVMLKRVSIGEHSILVYRIIKHLSSILGGTVVLYQLYILPRSIVSGSGSESRFWLMFTALFFATLAILWLIHPVIGHYTVLIKKIISSALLSLIFTCLLSRKKTLH